MGFVAQMSHMIKIYWDGIERVYNILKEQKEAHLWRFVHSWEKKSESVKTPDFRSHHQAFSPSRRDPIDSAALEVEYTLLGSAGQPVSNSKLAGRNTSEGWKRCCPARPQEGQLRSAESSSGKIGEGNVLKDLIWEDTPVTKQSCHSKTECENFAGFLGFSIVMWHHTCLPPLQTTKTLLPNTHKVLMDYWELWLRIQHVVLWGFIM